jgi:hypothetical protein
LHIKFGPRITVLFGGLSRLLARGKMKAAYVCYSVSMATRKGEIRASTKGLGSDVSKTELDERLLKEIQTWLKEMEKQKTSFKSWFRLEFHNRFPEFEKWKKK